MTGKIKTPGDFSYSECEYFLSGKKEFLLDFSTQVVTLFFTRYCVHKFTHNTIPCQKIFEFRTTIVFMKGIFPKLTSHNLMFIFFCFFMTLEHSTQYAVAMAF